VSRKGHKREHKQPDGAPCLFNPLEQPRKAKHGK
jgi:hypothetical protein